MVKEKAEIMEKMINKLNKDEFIPIGSLEAVLNYLDETFTESEKTIHSFNKMQQDLQHLEITIYSQINRQESY